MLIAGLTGNFGMGKSSVLSIFKKLGARTIESDRIVNSLLKEKHIIREVRKIFGDAVFEGKKGLNKKKIGERIFSNRRERRRLEKLLHPLVIKRVNRYFRNMEKRNGILIVEVPLLFEGGYEDLFEKVITVYTTQKTALERLRQDGFSRNEALARLRAQMPARTKKKLSDYIIDNNGSRAGTARQVKKIYSLLLKEIQ
ncbi:MAG: dephospho-CoA kinase [Nitrospiraceae bacterium]|nr:MAG: dephospho-CoA kinase [Nitrospiraceae bacterium]